MSLVFVCQIKFFIVQSGYFFLVLPSYPVLTIILGYNNLADQILGSTIFGNANNVVVKSKFFSLAANLLLPINLCTVDLSIIWVG